MLSVLRLEKDSCSLPFRVWKERKNRKRVRQPVGKARGGKHCCLRTHRSATGTGTSALPPPRRRPRPSTPLSLPASYSFVVGFCVRSTLVPKSIPSTTPSVSLSLSLSLSFYLSCVRTQALPICLTGALLNFIIPKTSGTNCKRRRRNRRKRGQPTTKAMIMGTQGERPPAVAWFMERGRRGRRPGVSLSLRENPASSFGAPARERKRTRERFVLCCGFA